MEYFLKSFLRKWPEHSIKDVSKGSLVCTAGEEFPRWREYEDLGPEEKFGAAKEHNVARAVGESQQAWREDMGVNKGTDLVRPCDPPQPRNNGSDAVTVVII